MTRHIDFGWRIGFDPRPGKLHVWVKNRSGKYLRWRDGSTFQKIDKLVGNIISDAGHWENHRFIQFNMLVDLIAELYYMDYFLLPKRGKSFVYEFVKHHDDWRRPLRGD